MKFEYTKKFIYEKAAYRIKKRIDEKKITLKEIYPPNAKMISRITNGKVSPKNPYLIQDAVLHSFRHDVATSEKYHFGIVPKLDFKNEQEALWGTSKEIEENIPEIFQNLMYDLLLNNSELGVDLYNILCDYVPYAKYSTYGRLLRDDSYYGRAYYYNIFEDDILNNIDNARENAINLLFSKPACKETFAQAFITFAANTYSFKKLDNKIQNQLVIPYIIPMLKRYIPDNTSLGLRVKDIIEADISKDKALIFIPFEYGTVIEKNYKRNILILK